MVLDKGQGDRMDVVSREEFEQAMKACGLKKECMTCGEEYSYDNCEWRCKGYGDSSEYKWVSCQP